MKINKIKPTLPDKVNGKLVKYKKGDCVSIKCQDGKYLAVLISEKFNRYYDFTLLEYYKVEKPTVQDFENGRVFGTRFGSWEELEYGVDKKMIECKYVDQNEDIELIASLSLIGNISKASYSYIKNIDELEDYYFKEIPIRIEKTINAEKFPAIAFVGKHLLKTKELIE
ncbi:MAG: hypothetical protein R2760_07190 [Chitinophagales bacterium]|nr:hypothetical protein [Bacteroidota bacterium]